jgi:TRAP-type mannitol/chloroaromatic compound transport system permease small subunit
VSPAATKLLAATADRLDAFTTGVGRVAAYFVVATVVICFVNVYLRYVLGIGFVWLQESYIWTHVAAIMFGSSYALLLGGFVRVDMLYARMSVRAKAWVDLLGTIVFMGPFLWMAGASGWSFFLASWRMSERSAYESGLPGTYALKATIVAFAVLVGIQGLAIVCRCLLTLLGHAPPARWTKS